MRPHLYVENGRYVCEGAIDDPLLMERRNIVGYGEDFRAAYAAWCAIVYGVVDESFNRVRAVGDGQGADPPLHS